MEPTKDDTSFSSKKLSFLYLFLGTLASYLSAWTISWSVAVWILPFAMISYTRQSSKGMLSLAFLALSVANFFTVHGAWHMGLGLESAFGAIMTLPLFIALIADRILHRKLDPLKASFVFPAVWTLFDYLYSFIPGMGDIFSPSLGQFHFSQLIQMVSITSIFGLTFLIGWFGSVAATIAASHNTLENWKRPALAFIVTFTVIFTFGSARFGYFDHDVETVRIASITSEHEQNYWEEIIDIGTPRSDAQHFLEEFQALEDKLFENTIRAANAGAEIIFWAEAAAPMYEDHEEAYFARASEVARENNIYLQTASIVMRYEDPMTENQATLFAPDGSVLYNYQKTQTWYPTESDGIIPFADTPYGRISTVICFDLDFPTWMRQVAKANTDILLVPGFDTLEISPYHTESGLFRGIEGGFNIVRGANESTSMAIDSTGRVLAIQDSFRTENNIMYSDVPTEGRTTIYGKVGNWFPWFTLLGFIGLIWSARRENEQVEKVENS